MGPASQSASPLFRGGQSVKVKDWLGGKARDVVLAAGCSTGHGSRQFPLLPVMRPLPFSFTAMPAARPLKMWFPLKCKKRVRPDRCRASKPMPAQGDLFLLWPSPDDSSPQGHKAFSEVLKARYLKIVSYPGDNLIQN